MPQLRITIPADVAAQISTSLTASQIWARHYTRQLYRMRDEVHPGWQLTTVYLDDKTIVADLLLPAAGPTEAA